MKRDLNYEGEGRLPISSNDLLDAYVAVRQEYPVIVSLLEELQYLRENVDVRGEKTNLSSLDQEEFSV